MIAFPSNGDERTPDKLDLEHSRQDIALVRSLARQGLLSEKSMFRLSRRLERVARTGSEERIRVAADKTLVTMQVALMRILSDSDKGSGGKSVNVENQQINIYLPENGRSLTNGNGKH